jgi:hypothetical protein
MRRSGGMAGVLVGLIVGLATFLFGLAPGRAGLVDNCNGTVSDSVTGLTWQQGDAHNSTSRNWEEALDYCECLTLAGKSDWRLPNVRELESIVAWDNYSPAIDTDYFPDCRSSSYWSGSTYAYYTDYAWIVHFYDGYAGYHLKANHYYVRCVRGGPSGSFDYFVEPLGICGGKTPCYTTIQAALNASGDGDTIFVRHGDYYESIVLDQDKSLTLLCGRGDNFGPSIQSSTAHDLEIRKGSLTVEGLHLVGE